MAYNNSPLMLATAPKPIKANWSYSNTPQVAQLLYTAGATNGSQVQKLAYNHTSTLAPNLFICRGAVVSGPSLPTGALNSASPATITRASGSFVTDGWLVGDLVWLLNPTTFGNALVDVVSVVAALTLTVTQNTIYAAETFAGASQKLVRLVQIGNLLCAVATASVPVAGNLLTASVIPGVLPNADAYLGLGPAELLVMKVSRTGQGITDVTIPLGASSVAYLNGVGEVADW